MTEPHAPRRVPVLVDARNVLRSQWPNLREQEVVERASRWADDHGAQAVLVFDGNPPPGAATEPHRLVGSGRESADAWIDREASELRLRGERYWLVTSDRALRAAAGGGAERVIGGGRFARELR